MVAYARHHSGRCREGHPAASRKEPGMMCRLIAPLAAAAAVAATTAVPAAATTTPPPPPAPPSAYVQTANYNNGCSDWSLRSNYPMSSTAPRWVFHCTNYDGYYTSQDSYYWNAEQQKVIPFDKASWDPWFDEYTD
jgi:hypothetical protein